MSDTVTREDADGGATITLQKPRLSDALRTDLHALVREVGERLPDDYLGPSELVLPATDSTLEEVRALLGDEGLIPG
jgi:hypothetical protein